MKNIETIIFDLGGVIVDLDVSQTILQFVSLSGLSPDDVRKHYVSHPAFVQFEKGLIDARAFRDAVGRVFSKTSVTDEVLDKAWNAMLVSIPKGKLDLLLKLKEKYQVMILSNTNSIHVDHIHDVMLPAVAQTSSFAPFVHEVYYSHHLNLRKPEPQIYEHVLKTHGLVPEKTAFLDDNIHNIEAAQALGIHSILVTHPDRVYEIFNQDHA